IILYSNKSFAKFLGLSLSKVIGYDFFEFVAEDFREQLKSLFSKGWEGSSKGEIMLMQKGGVWMPYSFSFNAMELEDAPALGMIITDLSAQNEIEAIKNHVQSQNEVIESKNKEIYKERLAKQEAERLAMILEGLPQIAWTANPEGLVTYFNQRWAIYTGINSGEVKDLWTKDVVHPDVIGKNITDWQSSMESGTIFEAETLFKRASDGMYRWHLCRARPLKDENGNIIMWLGTCTDMHDLKESQESLAHTKEQLHLMNLDLSQKNEQLLKTNNDLDNFVYTASHDLKAPVSNIEGLIATMADVLKKEDYNEDVDQIIKFINHSILKFKSTILALTEVTKTQKGYEDDIERQKFADIIDDIKVSINDIIVKSNARIHVDIIDCPEINFSKKNLHSILYNLIGNSIKYRSPQRPPEINISTKIHDGFIVLTVKDNGLGMDLSKGANIFSMFKRLHDHVEGSGVGLYIVKRIIDNAGGKIEVISEVGRGTTFRVYFKV
ncbi:MAG: ATP-binding protein, partial [Cytophagaceae bacterium]